jgi:hypothetical protein
MLEAIKEQVAGIPEKDWEEYDNGRQVRNYARFFYRCAKWDEAYRAL